MARTEGGERRGTGGEVRLARGGSSLRALQVTVRTENVESTVEWRAGQRGQGVSAGRVLQSSQEIMNVLLKIGRYIIRL